MLEAAQVLDMARNGVFTLLLVISPLMVIALVAGLIIALFQALTSIQEMTLTFVPKILLVFIALIMFLPFMADKLTAYARESFTLIAGGGG
jgi:flagellar biosynthetic protein FliQ